MAEELTPLPLTDCISVHPVIKYIFNIIILSDHSF